MCRPAGAGGRVVVHGQPLDEGKPKQKAARVVDDRSLDLPMSLRGLIAIKLEKSGVPSLQTAKIKGFVPIRRSDRASLYEESLPPGLILIE